MNSPLAIQFFFPEKRCLIGFLQFFSASPKAEQEEFEQMIQREEVSVMQFITSWEIKARREILLSLLGEKFSTVPPTISQQVQTIKSANELDRLLKQLIHANSIEETGLDGKKE